MSEATKSLLIRALEMRVDGLEKALAKEERIVADYAEICRQLRRENTIYRARFRLLEDIGPRKLDA